MKTLFALLLVITITASGLMSLLARDFKLTNGDSFSIMKLELPVSNTGVSKMIAAFAPGTMEAVIKQLNVDYIFMAGCYPGIMVLCLMAIRQITLISMLQKDLNKKTTGKGWKKLLLALTLLQLLAWGLDVWENAQIESWLNTTTVNDNIELLRARTFLKFGLGIAGFFTATFVLVLTRNLPGQLTRMKLISTLPKQKTFQAQPDML